jgi:glycosyltransferase involved in cell wall biosynthesis
MKASVLLLTHNEAINMPACLAALSWCDDIVVVDSGSTDGTVSMAARFGARILTRPFDDFATQRNFGLDSGEFRNEWVLHLDADEIVTPAFARAITKLVPEKEIYAWRVPFKVMFLGRWLRRSGMWPSYQVRLGLVKHLRFVQFGHGQREALPESNIATFPEALLHYPFSHGLAHWFEKHLRYAKDEADLIRKHRNAGGALRSMLLTSDATVRRRGAKALALRLPPFSRPLIRFFYVFILRRGFLDGMPGFVYAVMLSIYEAIIAVLLFDLRIGGRWSASGSEGLRLEAQNTLPEATLTSEFD